MRKRRSLALAIWGSEIAVARSSSSLINSRPFPLSLKLWEESKFDSGASSGASGCWNKIDSLGKIC